MVDVSHSVMELSKSDTKTLNRGGSKPTQHEKTSTHDIKVL